MKLIIKINFDAKDSFLWNFRAVTETINDVIAACLERKSTVTIERLECDNAIQEMETSKNLLKQSILQPCTNDTYFEALDHVVENSKRLGEAMTHIASASKNTNHELFKQAIRNVSTVVCRLVESSAQVKFNYFDFVILKSFDLCRQVISLVFRKLHQLKQPKLFLTKHCSVVRLQLFEMHVPIYQIRRSIVSM